MRVVKEDSHKGHKIHKVEGVGVKDGCLGCVNICVILRTAGNLKFVDGVRARI